MKYYFYKTDLGLMPMDNCKPFDKLEIGEEIEIDISSKRNILFHRKFFALINLAFENQSLYYCIEDLRKDLIKAAGFYEERYDYINDIEIIEAKSISFSNMDDTEFENVYNKVLDKVCLFLGNEKVSPGFKIILQKSESILQNPSRGINTVSFS